MNWTQASTWANNLKFNPDGSLRSDFGAFGNGTQGGQRDLGLVKNLQNYLYWSGTAYAPSPADRAWIFGFDLGDQNWFDQDGDYQEDGPQIPGFYAWAVRDGDVTVAAVPVPGSVALLPAQTTLQTWLPRHMRWCRMRTTPISLARLR